jgi:ATP-dependent RNA helicase RhlE
VPHPLLCAPIDHVDDLFPMGVIMKGMAMHGVHVCPDEEELFRLDEIWTAQPLIVRPWVGFAGGVIDLDKTIGGGGVRHKGSKTWGRHPRKFPNLHKEPDGQKIERLQSTVSCGIEGGSDYFCPYTSVSDPQRPKKPSILGRIKAKIKSVLGGKPKASSAPAESTRPHRPKAEQDGPRPRREGGDGRRRERDGGRREGEGAPQRTPRAPRERSEGQEERPPRERRERGERDRGPRSGGRERDRRDRGPRRETDGDEPRNGKPREVEPREVPPAPPEVPAGPYPAAFEVLGISPAVLAGIRESGYETPTTIQEKAIPLVIEGRDVIGASQTGTGKTAAFALPTLTRLGPPGTFRCLVLEPTRELAAQVVEQFEKYGKHTGLRVLLVHGGVGYDRQRKGLQRGVDVVVATPGRLLDFMQDGTACLDDINVLILDEVDRMLDMGFLPDVRRIVSKTPAARQTLFFSATMPPQIQNLADFALKDPVSIEIGIRFSPAETVSHYMYPVAGDQREELLLAILKQTHFTSVMIFTRTKVQADHLYAALMQMGEYKAAVMHSDIRQSEREAALRGFRSGEFDVIVATDLAARGLDISGVSHVINYMVPENPEDYVHRIGRTGRAQKEGDAYTLFAADELPFVTSIERLIDQKIERKKLPNFDYKYTTVLDDEDRARAILSGRKKKRR